MSGDDFRVTFELDGMAKARATVAKIQAEMKAESETTAERVMAWLDSAEPDVRRRFFVQYVEARRHDAAANDYAETRLSEMRAQLERLAQDVSDGAYHVQQFDHERLSDLIREVARG